VGHCLVPIRPVRSRVVTSNVITLRPAAAVDKWHLVDLANSMMTVIRQRVTRDLLGPPGQPAPPADRCRAPVSEAVEPALAILRGLRPDKRGSGCVGGQGTPPPPPSGARALEDPAAAGVAGSLVATPPNSNTEVR
jgi:hypothetical protein